jgi:hypothetical protein
MRSAANSLAKTQTIFFVLMSALAMVSVLFAGQALYGERERIATGYGDYVIYYSGAQIIRDGAGGDLYDLDQQRRYQVRFDVPIRKDVLPYNHPPYELLWHVPLTYLSYFNAFLVWSAINFGLLIGLARWFAPSERFDLQLMSWLMLFGFYPVLTVFLHGQDSILLLFLIAASTVALKRRKPVAAGVLLALASFKPQIVLPIALAWSCKSYRKAAVAWLVSVTSLVLLSGLMVGIPGMLKYAELISWIDKTNYTINPALMPNLRGLIHLLLAAHSPSAVAPLTGLLTLSVFAYIVYLWRRAPFATEMEFDATVALTVTLSALASYHAYTHDFTVLLLPALMVARSIISATTIGAVDVLLLIVLLILWIPFPFSYGPLLQAEKLAWLALLILVFAVLQAMQLLWLRHPSLPLQEKSFPSGGF